MRLGLIDFYNSIPLNLPIERRVVPLPEVTELVHGPPSFLNREVLAGRLDATPVSSIFFARNAARFRLLPDLSINSEGFVDSVTLFSDRPVEDLDDGRICVTTKSATSDVLLRILLRERFGVSARIVKGDPRPGDVGKEYDACLLIGDEALHWHTAQPGLHAFDLGDAWARFAKAPMVFAVWVAPRSRLPQQALAVVDSLAALRAAREWSEQHPDVIVEEAMRRSGLPRDRVVSYFKGLSYNLDDRKLEGLRRFLEAAVRIGELGAVPPIESLLLEVPA